MDSKLVVEQMSGRWKIKHEDMRRLALEARELVADLSSGGGSVRYTWIPRAREQGRRRAWPTRPWTARRSRRRLDGDPVGDDGDDAAADAADLAAGTSPADPVAGADLGRPTRLVLVRHGVTDFTVARKLDGRGGADPGLNALGRQQAAAAARAVRAFLGDGPVRVVSSSLARARPDRVCRGRGDGASSWRPTRTGTSRRSATGTARASASWPRATRPSWPGCATDDAYARVGGESHRDMAKRVLAAFERCRQQRGRRWSWRRTASRSWWSSPTCSAYRTTGSGGWPPSPASLTTVEMWSTAAPWCRSSTTPVIFADPAGTGPVGEPVRGRRTACETLGTWTNRLAYRVLTGPDDRAFCERVSAALADGYELHGAPAVTYDGERVIVAQALVLPGRRTGHVVSYAGDVQPEQAFAALQADATAVLVDVRTRAEWTYVGLPELSALGQGPVLVEWQRFPDGRVNDRFVDELRGGRGRPGRPGLLPLPLRRPVGRRGRGRHRRGPGPGVQRRPRLRGAAGRAGPPDRRRLEERPDCRGGKDEPSCAPTPWPCAAAWPARASRRRPRRSSSPRASSTRPPSEAEAAFTGEIDRFVYSRYGNPTVAMFEERLRLLEGARGVLRDGDGHGRGLRRAGRAAGGGRPGGRGPRPVRLVLRDPATRSCRGGASRRCSSTATTSTQWGEALSEPTAAVFFETPSNPMQELVDIAAVRELAHAAGAQVVVDNVFATPLFCRPLELGADVVVYSGTKHIDGQGRVLGGAILGTKEFIDGPVQNLMRHTGPAMSPFNAWVLLKGLETLALRVETAGRGRAASWPRALEAQPAGRAGASTRSWSRTRSTSWPSAR